MKTLSPCCHCGPTIIVLLVAVLATNLYLCRAASSSETMSAPPTTELSVAPSDHREFSSSRPDWVDALPDRVGDVDRWPVTTTPCRSESLCAENLRVSMRAGVETYIESITGVEASSSIVVFDDQWIDLHRDKSKTYVGSLKTGDETMYEAATVLRFDSSDRQLIERQWRRHQVGQRLAVLGATSGLATFALVGIAAALSVVTRRAEFRVAR